MKQAKPDIAFAEEVAGQLDLYLRESHGGTRTQLTDTSEASTTPGWSPEGLRLAYLQDATTGSGTHLRMRNVATASDGLVSDQAFSFGRPTVTPGGSTVLCAADGALVKIPVAGNGSPELIGDPSSGDQDPVFRGATEELIVSRPRGEGRALALINADGDLLYWITSGECSDRLPAHTLNGDLVYFARRLLDQPVGTDQVFRIVADGTNAIASPITSPNDFDYATSPSLSPSGRELVFEAAQGGVGERLYVMNVDGSGLRFLGMGAQPAWRPDPDFFG